MNPAIPRSPLACAAAALLLTLAACGGGGGGNGNASNGGGGGSGTPGGGTEQPVVLAQLNGVAATGAPFSGATVTVTDRTGATVCTQLTDENGAYRCELPAGTQAPLVIHAQRDDLSLYSTTASATGGVVNVTPLTTIIVSKLAPDGNPASLAGAIQTQPDSVTAASIQAQVTQLVTALKPLLDALGQGDLDLMNGSFVADGTGQDRLLDSIAVSVQPDGSAANIQITLKNVPEDGEDPPSISFSSSDINTPALPPVNPGTLVQPPSPAMISSFLARLNACYALPLAQRVTAVNDGVNAIGDASDLVAPACRTLFLGDAPSTYEANGVGVGRDSNGRGAFESMFRAGPTGLVHDRGNFEFFRNTSGISSTDVLITYRWTDVQGNTDNDTLLLRKQDGELKLVGNGNPYRVSVRPFAEKRDMINSPTYSYSATGYNVSIENRLDASFVPVLEKVVVTPPFGTQTYTYLPKPGLSFLTVARPGGDAANASGSVIYLGGRYDSAATSGTPADVEGNLNFVSPAFVDADVLALKDQGVWKLEFYLPGQSTPSTTQMARTITRAHTLNEIQQLPFAAITPTLRDELLAETVGTTDNVLVFGASTPQEPNLIDFSAIGDTAGWAVPANALAPTRLSAYGRFSGARWEDSVTVRNQARKAILNCSPYAMADTHCTPANPGPREYKSGGSLNTFELWARSARQVELSSKVGLYSVALP